MNEFVEQCRASLSSLLNVRELSDQNSYTFQELWTSPKATLIAQLAETSRCHVLVISASERTLSGLLQELPFFTKIPNAALPRYRKGPAFGL